MLTHIVILLDDTSTSYCHYEVTKIERRLISLDLLKNAIFFAMKENLNIQFVYPDYELPEEYKKTIDTIDHTKIKPCCLSEGADLVVLNSWKECYLKEITNKTYIIRTTRQDLSENMESLSLLLHQVERLNIVLTDVDSFKDYDIESYKDTIEKIADQLVGIFRSGRSVQLNLITDRIMLSEMNNCNAGECSITVAPNGKFYLCPAFYYDNEKNNVGDLQRGMIIKNRQLLRLDHAPICRNCDAFQCKRCIWMNEKFTLEQNTPSHQQCVIAHIERNGSSYLLKKLKDAGVELANSNYIEEKKELDPFNIVNKWK